MKKSMTLSEALFELTELKDVEIVLDYLLDQLHALYEDELGAPEEVLTREDGTEIGSSSIVRVSDLLHDLKTSNAQKLVLLSNASLHIGPVEQEQEDTSDEEDPE